MRVFLCLTGLLMALGAKAQTDDLMIVEYVDRAQGDGFAIEIYNPTNSSIDLSNYWVRVFNNGNTSPSSSTRLSGTLASKATFTFGNNAYSGSCGTTQNGGGITGVNGNDAITLAKGGANSTNWVDMVNLYGVDVFPKVDGVSSALVRRKIIRRCDNTTRYTSTDGTSPNSWPNNANTDVTGWISLPDSCVRPGFKEDDFLLNVGFSKSICEGESLTLDAGAGYKTYSWSTGEKTRSITVSKKGTYTILVDSAECLSGRDIFKIDIETKPVFDVGFDSTICQGSDITLDAGSFGSYLWQNFDKSQDLSTNQTLTVSQEGKYIITVNKGLCSEVSDTFDIKVVGPANLSVGFDSMLCVGQTIVLDAGAGFQSYLWTQEGKGNTFDRTFNATESGRYILTVDKDLCSQASDTFNLIFKPVPFFSLGADTSACEGSTINLTAAAGFANYKWTKDSNLLPVSASSLNAKDFGAGLYAVTVNEGGCDEFTARRNVGYMPFPVAPSLRDTTLCEGESAVLDAGAGYDSYRWSNGQSTQGITVSQAGVYSVVVKKLGCEATAQAEVKTQVCIKPQLLVYNTFSPNGDGKNETFFIEGLNDFGPVSVEIFNRWGQRVFESSDYRNTWTGDTLVSGTYFYVIKPSKTGETLKGTLVILK